MAAVAERRRWAALQHRFGKVTNQRGRQASRQTVGFFPDTEGPSGKTEFELIPGSRPEMIFFFLFVSAQVEQLFKGLCALSYLFIFFALQKGITPELESDASEHLGEAWLRFRRPDVFQQT